MSNLMNDTQVNARMFLLKQIPHVTGALSMFGSGWIMAEVLLDQKKRKMPYHRIMFGLSFFDFISSFGFFLSNWTSHGSLFDLIVKGSVFPCNAAGFACYLGSLTIPLYNASLSIYYHLVICRSWSEKRIEQNFEWYVRILIPSFGISIAIIPLIMQLYHQFYFYCFPVNMNGHGISGVTADALQLLTLVIVLFSASSMAYSMISITIKVKKIFQRATMHGGEKHRCFSFFSCYCFSSLCQNKNDNNRYDTILQPSTKSSFNTSDTQRDRRFKSRARRVVNMSLLYLIPFIITWVLPCILYLLARLEFQFHIKILNGNRWSIIVQEAYISTLLPIQGFFNWLVYMYRRYQTKKSEQQGCISCCDLIKIIGKVLLRILNLQGTEDDGDCLLGSGAEKIVFEKYDEERKDDLDRAQLVETPSLSNNIIMDYEEELSSIELSNIETEKGYTEDFSFC